MVRPILVPMAEGAAQGKAANLSGRARAIWVIAVGWWRSRRLDRRLQRGPRVQGGTAPRHRCRPLGYFFIGCGVVLAIVAAQILGDATHPKRWGSALFWPLLAVAVGDGSWLPHAAVGHVVVGLTVLTAMKQVGVPQFAASEASQLEASARRLGNRVLLPVPVVPAPAVTGGRIPERVSGAGFVLASARQAPQIAPGLGCAVALVLTSEGDRGAAVDGGAGGREWGSCVIVGLGSAFSAGARGARRNLGRGGAEDAIAQVVATVLPVHLPRVAVLAYLRGHGVVNDLARECVRGVSDDDARRACRLS